jgi:hypothetical protein
MKNRVYNILNCDINYTEKKTLAAAAHSDWIVSVGVLNQKKVRKSQTSVTSVTKSYKSLHKHLGFDCQDLSVHL